MCLLLQIKIPNSCPVRYQSSANHNLRRSWWICWCFCTSFRTPDWLQRWLLQSDPSASATSVWRHWNASYWALCSPAPLQGISNHSWLFCVKKNVVDFSFVSWSLLQVITWIKWTCHPVCWLTRCLKSCRLPSDTQRTSSEWNVCILYNDNVFTYSSPGVLTVRYTDVWR